MSKPILCVDFDGVIHSYSSGWKGETVIPDPPVAGALQWLWKATEWWNVQVYSSRSKSTEAIDAMKRWMRAHALLAFDSEHPMASHAEPYPIGFAFEKPPAFLTIDDRAICFDGMWHDLDPYALLSFRPWNKREFGGTGAFPRGQLEPSDEGELRMGIAADIQNGVVRLAFGKPVAWVGMPPDEAAELGRMLIARAEQVAKGKRT